ncbi:hypothetical protein [Paenibacillus pabuli]|uniref:hypothetical protein n=1 Tax=Paenibacillus pabuli TaxID=1472 RepID=UPI000782888B|nr:hypothetical protein [Paenibacillus pabuli]MEC0129145.1 hypothetical protein [Paenibacillus pabuli]
MNLIHFKIEPSQEETNIKVLNIYINNENLIEIIKRYEVQFDPKIAGNYDGLNINFYKDIDEHFFGELNENDLFNYDGKTQILGCDCGEPGCWPLLIKISVSDEIIVWSDFEQPYRNEDSAGGYWDYSNLKPFVFHRKQYEEQIKEIYRNFNKEGISI